MKAFVTSVGEPTEEICCWQLERLGFDVVLLNENEPWIIKYKKFIEWAEEDCIRIDADTIVNKNAKIIKENITGILPILRQDVLMVSFQGYDFYRNNIGCVSPIFYRKEALDIIRLNFEVLDTKRPETSAWRLPEIVNRTYGSNLIVSMHGFFQTQKEFERALKNKKDRKQMKEFDFELAKRILNNFINIKL